MRRIPTYGVVAAFILGVGAAAATQQPVFRGATDLVRVFVTVTDRDGRLVTSLAQGDFEVRDEGRPQPIALFDNTPQPVRLVLMLDVSGSMAGNLRLLRAASQQLVARLRPDDRARVGSFGRAVKISPDFTRDARALLDELPDAIDPDAPTPLWHALDAALDVLREEGEQRPVILVFSDGKDSGPTVFGGPGSSQAEVIDRARRENVMIYAVGMRSRGERRPMRGVGPGALREMLLEDMPDPGLARVAEESGGGYSEIRFGQDLGAEFARVADELHSQYLIGFAPPARDGKVHDIDVRLSSRGLKARARKSYVARR